MKTDPETFGAALASQFARECGLSAGNLWEPSIARELAAELRERPSAAVEAEWRARLGLEPKQ